jgi:hypothetical protein
MSAEVLKRKKRKKREERKERKRRKGRDETIAFYLEVPSHFGQGEQSISSHKYEHYHAGKDSVFLESSINGSGG